MLMPSKDVWTETSDVLFKKKTTIRDPVTSIMFKAK